MHAVLLAFLSLAFHLLVFGIWSLPMICEISFYHKWHSFLFWDHLSVAKTFLRQTFVVLHLYTVATSSWFCGLVIPSPALPDSNLVVLRTHMLLRFSSTTYCLLFLIKIYKRIRRAFCSVHIVQFQQQFDIRWYARSHFGLVCRGDVQSNNV